MTDITPVTNSANNIHILTATASDSHILSTQTLTFTIDTLVTSIFTSGNSLYVLFPSSYSKWIARAQTMSTSTDCSFMVTSTSTNLASACTFISQRILKIDVGAITNQLFTITLNNVKTPPAVPEGKFNQYRFKMFVADASQNTVTYYTFTDFSPHFTLTANPALVSLSWNSYGLSVSDSFFTLTPAAANEVIIVQKGYYSKVVELRQSIYPNNFRTSLNLSLSNYVNTSFTASMGTLAVTLGKPTAYFRLAAATTTSTGLYVLEFNKVGDTNNVYTNIPPLTVVVQNTQCALTTSSTTYTLPIGGMTLPIMIDALNCIPVTSINISVAFTGTGNSEFSVHTDLSTSMLTKDSDDGQIYFVFRHTAGSLIAGNSVTADFTISGTDSAHYAAIASVTLTLLDAATFQTVPTATALSSPTLSGNTATLQLQCSQASRIYWGVSVYP